MYDTGGSHSVCRPTTRDADIAQRMSWLSRETDPAAERRRLAWEKEQTHLLAMREPMTTEQAYELFGTFLGMLPPLAIFSLYLDKGSRGEEQAVAVFICMVMNVTCTL